MPQRSVFDGGKALTNTDVLLWNQSDRVRQNEGRFK